MAQFLLSARFVEIPGEVRIGVKMEMGVSGVQPLIGKYTFPLLSADLGGSEAFPGLGAIPAVEFMSANGLPRPAQQVILPGGQGHIPEAGQFSIIIACSRQKVYHWFSGDGLRQVHKSAAFGDAGQAPGEGFPHGTPHGGVFAELPGVQLRIAAAQVQPVQIFRQFFIGQGAERHQFRSHFLQRFQIVSIVKAERLVPGHADAHPFLPGEGDLLAGDGFRRFRQGQQAVQIQGFFRLAGQNLHFFLQIRHFSGGD